MLELFTHHGLMRIPSKIHSGGIIGLLSIDILTVGKVDQQRRTILGRSGGWRIWPLAPWRWGDDVLTAVVVRFSS